MAARVPLPAFACVRRAAVGLVSAAALWAVLGAGLAAGAGTLELLGSFGSLGSEPGQLANPRGLAVDASSGSTHGDVYVADQLNQRIERFGPTGAFAGTFGGEGSGAGQMRTPFGVAVDPRDGDVYVEDLSNHRIDKFDAGGAFLFAFGGDVNQEKVEEAEGGDASITQAEENLCRAGEACGEGALAAEGQSGEGTFHRWAAGAIVAVDGSGAVYVGDEDAVQEFGSAGAYRGQVALPGMGRLSALAVDSAGRLYAKGQLESGVREYDSTGALLRTFDEGSSSVTGVAVSPDGAAVYVLDGGRVLSYDSTGTLLVASQDGEIETSTGIAATASGTVYVSNFHPFKEPPAQVLLFGTPPSEGNAPPSIDAELAARVGTTTATLAAKIDPQFLSSTYYVQYGLDSSYSAGALPAPPGASLGLENLADDPASVPVGGLRPGTTYHYRFVAISAAGTTYGPDRTFTTYLPGSSVADGRAYELVSPPEKNSADVAVPGAAGGLAFETGRPIQAAPDGEAITYGSFTSFGDPQSAPATSQYVSRRGTEGWSTQDVSPPDEAGYVRDPLRGFSSDLSKSVLVQNEPLLATGAVEGFENLYLRDDHSGALRALTTSMPRVASGQPYCIAYAGASADFSHVIFTATGALTQDAPAGPGNDLYEWSAQAGLRLVSVLGEGTPATPGQANGFGAGGFGCTVGDDVVHNAISRDGSRVVWTYRPSVGASRLLLREGLTRTVQLDAPRGGSGTPGEGTYWGASADGSKVVFADSNALTADASAEAESSLYEYDVASERLTDLTPSAGGEAVHVLGVAGMSEDAAYVYFVAEGALTAGAKPRADNLYVWHAGAIHLVAVLSSADRPDWSGQPFEQSARVTPDGRSLAFVSREGLTGYDNVDQASGTPDGEIYVYDAPSEALTCVSCNPSGARPTGSATLPGWSTVYEQPRDLSESGHRLFFQSEDALALRDTNGRQDVYEWESAGEGGCTSASAAFSDRSNGCVYPISTGTSGDDSHLLDASADGRDVFISTRQSLVEQDEDERFDVYDARVGGGFPAPPTQPLSCSSEACRPPTPSAAPLGAPASETFSGPGNRHAHTHRAHRKRPRKRHKRRKRHRRRAPHVKRHRAAARAHASAVASQPGVSEFAVTAGGPGGEAVTQAGAHPDHLTVSFAFDTVTGPEGFPEPAGGPIKDIRVHLPAGLIGDPSAVPQCTAQAFDTQLGSLEHPTNACPDASAVGTIDVFVEGHIHYVVPVYELLAPHGMPAQLGFQILGAPFYIDVGVRSDSDYGIDASMRNVSEAQKIVAATLTLWGVPADPSHDAQRGTCLGGGSLGSCPAGAAQRPFLTLPTSCQAAPAQLSFDTWREPDAQPPPASAALPASTDCAALDFNPSISLQPDDRAANGPTGLALKLHVPQNDDPHGLAEAELRDAVVRLPEGLTVNPAVGGGLSACSETEVGFERIDQSTHAALFSDAPASCPEASRIGDVKIRTPLLATPLTGGVYVAEQGDAGPAAGANPFGSLLALYVVAEGSGVLVKLAGEARADPATGRLTVTFDGAPQLPYEDFELDLYGGQRAPLVTPAACGSYATTATLTPWSTPESGPATREDAFSITNNCTPGFTPSFDGGTTSNQAGGFSPLRISIARADGEQPLGAIAVRLPKGVEAVLAHVQPCQAAQASTGSCPAASLIGHARVQVGAGAYPLALGGGVYLTGPYEGAPFGLAVAVPAVAGPFDLGDAIVRARVEIDRRSGQITVASDPLPRIRDGVPLDLRAVDIEIDRHGFLLNPTSCDPLALRATIASATGSVERLRSRFQAAGCSSLPFRPRVSAAAHVARHRRLGASLHATLRSSLGQANVGSVRTVLPRGLAARDSTLKDACLEATFRLDPAACPAASVVGRSVVWTPLLPGRLAGPVYLVSREGAFPRIVVVLQGDGVRVELLGRTAVGLGGLTSATFGPLPDVPVRRFELVLPTGRHSLLGRSRAACGARSRTALEWSIVAQDGAAVKRQTPLAALGCRS